MKYLVHLLFVLLLVFGCQSNGDDVEIFGQWQLIEWFDITPRDINGDGEASTDLLSQWQGCKKQSTLVLLEDMTGKIVYDGESNNLNCPEGFESGDFFTTDPWEYDKDEQKLEFLGDDSIDVYEIVELSEETLVLEGSGIFTCCNSTISYYTGGFLRFERI